MQDQGKTGRTGPEQAWPTDPEAEPQAALEAEGNDLRIDKRQFSWPLRAKAKAHRHAGGRGEDVVEIKRDRNKRSMQGPAPEQAAGAKNKVLAPNQTLSSLGQQELQPLTGQDHTPGHLTSNAEA